MLNKTIIMPAIQRVNPSVYNSLTFLSPDDQNEDGTYTETQIAKKTPLAISSFSETPSGEILVCGFPNAYASKGKIYLLVPSSSTTSSIR